MFYHLIYPLHVHLSFLNVFKYITVRAAFAAITAFLVMLIIGEVTIRLLRKKGIVQEIRKDGPKKHTRSKRGIPTMGGIMMIIAFFVSILLWGRFDSDYIYIVSFAVLWFGFIGFLDDYLKLKIGTKGLSAKGKLILQFLGGFIITAVYIYFNRAENAMITHLNVPFIKQPFYLPVWIYGAFTALVIVGWSNAVNLTDGLDGLASGLSLFVFATLLVLAYIIGNIKMSDYLLIMYIAKSSELTIICAALAGAVLGFLWFNSYPAQVFMGDVGALMLGGVVGTIAVLIKQEIRLILNLM